MLLDKIGTRQERYLDDIATQRDNGSLSHDQASRLCHDVVIMQMADSAGEGD